MSLVLALALACGAGAPSADPPIAPAAPSGEPTGAALPTRKGLYTIRWTAEPSPIPLSELFVVAVELRDAKTGAPVESGAVRVNAQMPQHGHGMATKPQDDPGVPGVEVGTWTHPQGRYRTEGMKFHMPGAWTLSFQVEGPSGPDELEVVYAL